MVSHRTAAVLLVILLVTVRFGRDAAIAQNHPPNPPTITEPSADGNVVNAADVHMETAPFSDPDPGDTHLCTDWEIWSEFPVERVWVTSCIGGVEKVHTHLGDGIFEGSHAGRSALMRDNYYTLHVRHRDNSGDPLTEWSDWSIRGFQTGPEFQIFAMTTDDIAPTPPPHWNNEAGGTIILAPGNPSPSLRIESNAGQLLAEIRSFDGLKNQTIDSASLAQHVPIRVVIFGGSQGLTLPLSHVTFTDHEGIDRTLYFPPLTIAPQENVYYWISGTGASYAGISSQTEPDFTTFAQAPPIPWFTNESGYKVELSAAGFQLPINIAFVPTPGLQPTDPYYYVTELYGKVKVVLRNGIVLTYADSLLNYDPTSSFPGSGEQGVSGIVVDSLTGDVIVSMLYDSGSPDSVTHFPKVIRLHSPDGGKTASSQTTVLDMPGETQGQSHFISNLTIGPDRKLYVHMGDGFDAERALDLDSFRGKILRVNLDGTAPTDNPFYDAGDGISARDYIFAYGFRNPFGGTWRTADGSHYEVENGPDNNDRIARVTAGISYGWDGTAESMLTNAAYIWPQVHAPVNIAFVQPSTFNGSGFPSEKMDHAFVTESGPTWDSGPQGTGKRIVEFVFDAGGKWVSGPATLAEYVGVGKASASGLAAGPDGLYFTDLYKDLDYVTPVDPGANVLVIRFVGVARFKANTTAGNAPVLVQFTDTSNVPNPTSWSWDFGDSTSSSAQNPAHIYTREGSFDVRLTVTGPRGTVATQKNSYIVISSGPPLATQVSGLAASLSNGLHVLLSWATISELNNYGFYVQRRTSVGQPFADLAGSFVPGHETSIIEHEYSFVDSLPPAGILYYRLRQVDLDQQEHFSDTVSVSVVPLATKLSPLMVSLSADSRVHLSWTTLTELNNFGFYVQRRPAASQTFADLPGSFVRGHATSIIEHEYAFVDSLPPVGTLFYRLRQADLDSTQHFSDTVSVNIVTDVTDRAPIQFALLQNYPNPFNPQTEIKFSVDATNHTTLCVYNTLGQQIATLFDDVAEPGRFYRVTFDGGKFSSGVYFYRVQSGTRTQLRKFVLLK